MTEKPTANKGQRHGHKPTLVIIHADAGGTDAGTIDWIVRSSAKAGNPVSYHYLVGRDGTVYRFVKETEKAWHAGKKCRFHGEEVEGSLNPTSIGVCFANNGKGDEFYTVEQYKAGAQLVADICKRNGIPVHRIRGHFEVCEPGYKQDPYPWFNWRTFYLWFSYFSADRKDDADWERWADLER